MIRLQDERHSTPFHLRIAFNLADEEKLLLDLVHQVATEVEMGHLTTFEAQGELHLVSFLEEVAGVVHLDQEIVVTDAHGVDIQLLKTAAAGICAGLIFLFLLLISPFTVIHDSANGGTCGRSNFDKVEPGFARHAERFSGGNDSNLFFLVVDEPDRRNADLLIVAKLRRNGVNLLMIVGPPAEHTFGSESSLIVDQNGSMDS